MTRVPVAFLLFLVWGWGVRVGVGEPTGGAVEDAAKVWSAVQRAPRHATDSGHSDHPSGGDAPPKLRFPELDCIRPLLSPVIIDAAERRSARLGTGGDRVLIAAGIIDEETYVRALAAQAGVIFEPLDSIPRALCSLPDNRLIKAAATGLLPLIADNEFVLAIAPRSMAARRLSNFLHPGHPLARRLRFTTMGRLNEFVLRHGGRAIAARATGALKEAYPMLSAGAVRQRWHPTQLSGSLIPFLVLIGVVLMSATGGHILGVTLALIFLSWLGLRFAAAFIPARIEPATAAIADEALPVYTIIAALYREAASVDGLLHALERLDYPSERLEIILALEADDHETRAAVAARKHRIPTAVVTVPTIGPRTKPKALNVALSFARGRFTVVYDAEDRPEPDQLRRALCAFRSGGDDLACVQARLCIDNTADSWLVRLFTAEYAGQFDVFLPGMAAISLPLPLGGSSNHFRTAALREVGAWDPYNVTEDADMGIRLARFGYRTGMIGSTTYEEAPACVRPWLRQRTRWFKGWMQTWLVHMRQPRLLIRELGWAGFLAFQLCVGGNALAALVHPFFLGLLIAAPVTGFPLWAGHTKFGIALCALYAAAAAVGYLVSAFTGWLGLKRRGLQRSAWVLLLIPVHWILLSIAAWRALYQLAVAPYAWEKTQHGVAKSSRIRESSAHSTAEIEGHLRRLKTRAGIR